MSTKNHRFSVGQSVRVLAGHVYSGHVGHVKEILLNSDQFNRRTSARNFDYLVEFPNALHPFEKSNTIEPFWDHELEGVNFPPIEQREKLFTLSVKETSVTGANKTRVRLTELGTETSLETLVGPMQEYRTVEEILPWMFNQFKMYQSQKKK